MTLTQSLAIELPFMADYITWVSQWMPVDGDQFSALMFMIWLWMTPAILNLSALIIGVRNTADGRWDRRMSRASFLLILSYAVLIDRVYLRYIGVLDGSAITGETPEWPRTTFYVLCTVYYGISLVLDHVIPFTIRMVRGQGRDPVTMEGIDDA